VLIAADRSTFKLAESRNAMTDHQKRFTHAARDAHVIYSTAYDEVCLTGLRVTVIATGLTSARARAQTPRMLGGAATATLGNR
jgi:cell division protein FtsZ